MNNLKTLLLDSSVESIKTAGKILRNGGLVAMPTETVYGLAANALDEASVLKIFQAKGRPADNPLIVHISDFNDIEKFGLVSQIPDSAIKLAESFWPGPLTMIMKKAEAVPKSVSAGLDTVAIRLPKHKIARELIRSSGVVLAAPSANISGSPSPTTANHVVKDMNGKIDAIVDGGMCEVGVESTVITLATDVPRVLRPGGVTLEQLRAVLGEVEVDPAVFNGLADGEKASSPGMKYKHYAPKARVVLLKCSDREYIDYVNNEYSSQTAALCCDEDIPLLKVKCFSLGKRCDNKAHAHRLFDELRKIDEAENVSVVYSRLPSPDGVGMAVYNRLIRAAGFEVIDLEKN